MDNLDLAIKCSRMWEGLDIHVCNISIRRAHYVSIEISQVQYIKRSLNLLVPHQNKKVEQCIYARARPVHQKNRFEKHRVYIYKQRFHESNQLGPEKGYNRCCLSLSTRDPTQKVNQKIESIDSKTSRMGLACSRKMI